MNPEATPPASSPAAEQQTEPRTLAPQGGQPAVAAGSLLDSLVQSTVASSSTGQPSRLEQFLAARQLADALPVWLGAPWEGDVNQLLRKLNSDVARIDQHINRQINAILHAPEFQRLEAAWRGLDYLTKCVELEGGQDVKIRFLRCTQAELTDDFDDAIDFDQSHLFREIYDQEFGMAGGEPFGVLIGDFDFGIQDVELLASISKVAAAAFCPFISNASPAMFDLESFAAMERDLDHARTLEQSGYRAWHSFRSTEEARFVGLTLPHVLMRLPYAGDQCDVQGFLFTEETSVSQDYLWGGAAFAFGEVLIRAFAESGWLADIRGVRRGFSGGGLVQNLPVHSMNTDNEGLVVTPSTDLIVTDELEKQLSDLGFVPLCDCYDTEFSAFYSAQSVQSPKKFDRSDASMNAKISTMLQYMFCVSRFAHYLKAIGRDRIGQLNTPQEIERELNRWLANYVAPDSEASPEVKARYPLFAAKVQVLPEPGKPGSFQAILQLMPHYQLEDIQASLTLVTQLEAQ